MTTTNGGDMAASRHRALPEVLVGAVRSRIGTPTSEDIAALAFAEDAELDKSRSPAGHHMKRRSCVEKQRYGRRSAHRAARVLRDAQGQEVHPYPCVFCTGWHVGHGIDIPADARGAEAPETLAPVGPPLPAVVETWPASRPWVREPVRT